MAFTRALPAWTLILSSLSLACSRNGGAPEARADQLPRTLEPSPKNTGTVDAAPRDAGAQDAGAKDAGAKDAGPAKAIGDLKKAPELADGVLTLWPMGDSITLGVAGGYRNRLYELLVAEGIKVDYVGSAIDDSTQVADKDHDGHSGFTILNAREHVDEWFPKVQSPDAVLILLGTNDFAWWTNRGPFSHLQDMNGLLDYLLSKLPKSKLLVATIPPQSSAMIETVKIDRQVMTKEYNELLKKTLPQHPAYGKRLFLVDLNAVLQVTDLYDGIHPTGTAHNKMAEVWHQAIHQALGN